MGGTAPIGPLELQVAATRWRPDAIQSGVLVELYDPENEYAPTYLPEWPAAWSPPWPRRDARLVGRMLLTPFDDWRHVIVSNVEIARGYRGLGHATRMYRQVGEWVAAAGGVLASGSLNEHSKAVWDRLVADGVAHAEGPLATYVGHSYAFYV